MTPVHIYEPKIEPLEKSPEFESTAPPVISLETTKTAEATEALGILSTLALSAAQITPAYPEVSYQKDMVTPEISTITPESREGKKISLADTRHTKEYIKSEQLKPLKKIEISTPRKISSISGSSL